MCVMANSLQECHKAVKISHILTYSSKIKEHYALQPATLKLTSMWNCHNLYIIYDVTLIVTG